MFSGITFVDLFDILRFLLGTILTELILVEGNVNHRKNFKQRVGLCFLGFLVVLILYIFFRVFQLALTGHIMTAALVTALWWILSDCFLFWCFYFCYEMNYTVFFYFGILSLAFQEIITMILQYLICKKLLPDFETRYPVMYIGTAILVYGVFEVFLYFGVSKRLFRKNEISLPDSGLAFVSYLGIFILMNVVTFATSTIFEWANNDSVSFGNLEIFQYYAVPYYCIGINIIICITIIALQLIMYEMNSVEQEKRMLIMLQKEKEQQYLFNRENIELINAKCHDLKYQLKALASVHGEDRDRLLAETEQAIGFYEASIETGNGALDTILTEKSLLCRKHDIRLSCNVQVHTLDKAISVIDLYTVLGNALDNAIECVCEYENKEKRVISISILENGNILSIIVDNYYDGELYMKNGFPVTHKSDTNYHGYGVKSIRMIAKKYHGDIRISNKNNTFSIQIMMRI